MVALRNVHPSRVPGLVGRDEHASPEPEANSYLESPPGA
jgi:hypothetical protein